MAKRLWRTYIKSVIKHELAHWADEVLGGGAFVGEEGYVFERELRGGALRMVNGYGSDFHQGNSGKGYLGILTIQGVEKGPGTKRGKVYWHYPFYNSPAQVFTPAKR